MLGFLLGLSIGMLLLAWQRSRSDIKIRRLLQRLASEQTKSSLSAAAQLSMAIAYQQQVQRRLEQQIAVDRQILMLAPIGYLQVDDENRLVWCNPQARELLGITQDQYPKPRLLLELVRSYELDQLIEQTRQLNEPYQRTWTFHPISLDPLRLSQQQEYPLRGYGLPLPQDHVGIFLESRQEAAMLLQQRDRWASDVAHELKTPLTSIRLVAETLHMRVNPALQSWIDRLINETIRLSNLVQDLLDLSQLDRDAANCLNLKTVDLVELIDAAWLNLEPLAGKKHLQLDYSGPKQLLLQLDEPRMYRVLLNLLDNSIKYSPPRQTIRVQIELEKSFRADALIEQVHLEVIDAGPGFPESDLPFVFERFYRSDPARSRSPVVTQAHGDQQAPTVEGLLDPLPAFSDRAFHLRQRQAEMQHRSSGLGLSIVRQIVEAHHGSVSASNHPETGGAWLQVYLPLQLASS
jgi:two-component system phosphate regulon sensor histidine kinase PhoR